MARTLLFVEPDPGDPHLWRYGRANDAGELDAFGHVREVDGCIEQVDDPGWPIAHDAVTAMCLIRQARGERAPITYDLAWKPVAPLPPRSREPARRSPAEEHRPTLGERAATRRRDELRS